MGLFDDVLEPQQKATGSSGLFDDVLQPQDKPKEKSSTLRRAGDFGITALKGAIGVPEAALGIADLATGGRAGKLAEEAGFRPKEAKDILDTYLTPEQQEANRKVSEAKGFIPTIQAAVENPSTIAHTVVESVPAMLGGGVVAQFNRKDGSAGQVIPRDDLDRVISSVVARWKSDREAVVVAPTFGDLPAAIRAQAEQAGYDNTNPDDRITGVAYKGKVYLVHENIRDELEAEEALLHEHIHRVLRAGGKDAFIKAMNNLYLRLGGGKRSWRHIHQQDQTWGQSGEPDFAVAETDWWRLVAYSLG